MRKENNKPGNPRFPGLFEQFIGFFVAFLVVGAWVFLPYSSYLVLEEVKNDKLVFLEPLPEGSFAISYTHSVNKSKIVDSFRTDKAGRIILQGSRFLSFGAGVSGDLTENGTFSGSGDTLEFSNINRPLPEFRLFIGTEADHVLSVPSGEYRLSKLAPPQTSLRIACRRLSAFEAAAGEFMKGASHGRS